MSARALIDEPNYTMMPNIILDSLAKDMSEAELRIILAISRKTFGWHKERDVISLSQLVELTGMSKQGVLNGIETGVEHGLIERIPHGQSYSYRLIVTSQHGLLVNEVDQLSPKLVNEVDQLSPKLVNEVDTQKKQLNKVNLKKEQPKKSSAAPPPKPKVIESFTVIEMMFLGTFGAVRFKNNVQRETIKSIERTYSEIVIGEYLRWCANRGLSLGHAITNAESTLKKWGEQKPSWKNQPVPVQTHNGIPVDPRRLELDARGIKEFDPSTITEEFLREFEKINGHR